MESIYAEAISYPGGILTLSSMTLKKVKTFQTIGYHLYIKLHAVHSMAVLLLLKKVLI